MLLWQYQEYHIRETKAYVESKVNQITGQYEGWLKTAIEQKEHAQKKLVATKLELERALEKLNDLDEEVNHEQKQRCIQGKNHRIIYNPIQMPFQMPIKWRLIPFKEIVKLRIARSSHQIL